MAHHDLSTMSWPKVAELGSSAIGLIPVGATEQHGPHLPVLTDSLFAGALARRVADRLPAEVLVTPVLHIGRSDHHTGFPGTITLDAATYEAVVSAHIDALRRIGITRVAMFSGHGGNFTALGEIAARYEERDADVRVVAYTDLLRFLEVMMQAGRETGLEAPATDVHAGALETSFALELFPDLVGDHSAVAGYVAGEEGWMQRLTAEGAASVSDNGVFGDPRLANQETGRQVVERCVAELAGFIERELGL
jgi:creatinine amidohydrolase